MLYCIVLDMQGAPWRIIHSVLERDSTVWKALFLWKWLMTRDKTWVSLLVFAHGIPRLVPEASYLENEVHPSSIRTGALISMRWAVLPVLKHVQSRDPLGLHGKSQI